MGNLLCGLKKQTYYFDDTNSVASGAQGTIKLNRSPLADAKIRHASSQPCNTPLSTPTEKQRFPRPTEISVNDNDALCKTTRVMLAALNVTVNAADVIAHTANVMVRSAERHAVTPQSVEAIRLAGEVSLIEKLTDKIKVVEGKINERLIEIDRLNQRLDKNQRFQAWVVESSNLVLSNISDKKSIGLRKLAKEIEEKNKSFLLDNKQEIREKEHLLSRCQDELLALQKQLMEARQRKIDAKNRHGTDVGTGLNGVWL